MDDHYYFAAMFIVIGVLMAIPIFHYTGIFKTIKNNGYALAVCEMNNSKLDWQNTPIDLSKIVCVPEKHELNCFQGNNGKICVETKVS